MKVPLKNAIISLFLPSHMGVVCFFSEWLQLPITWMLALPSSIKRYALIYEKIIILQTKLKNWWTVRIFSFSTFKLDVLLHVTLQTFIVILVFWLPVCSEKFATGRNNTGCKFVCVDYLAGFTFIKLSIDHSFLPSLNLAVCFTFICTFQHCQNVVFGPLKK